MSRRSHVGYTGVHWAQGDLLTGAGIDAAVWTAWTRSCTAPHKAPATRTSPRCENLITAARSAGSANIIYVSIVGIDRIPLPYYKTKLRVEQALEASGVGHTVLRATQFHDLIETIFSIQRFSPLLWALRGVRFQPIDTRDVAARLVELIDSEPAGRVADIGGPAVHTHARAGTDVPHGPRRPSTRRRDARAGAHRRRLPSRARTWCRTTRSAPSASPSTSPNRIKFAIYLLRRDR